MVNADVSEKVAMEISGHKTRSVFDRYHIGTQADKVKAMRRVQDAPKDLIGYSERKVKTEP